MSFAFNFSGDDIESSDNDLDGATEQVNDLSLDAEAKREDGEQVRVIPLDELLSALPSRIAYSSTLLTSPRHGHHAIIPRRALFDVRLQLMAENEDVGDGSQPKAGSLSSSEQERKQLTGLGDSDIEQNVYEGGFKSWEGAMDLALLLLDEYGSGEEPGRAETDRPGHVVELGCGTALPSLTYLHTHFARLQKHHTQPQHTNTNTNTSDTTSTPLKPPHLHLTLADYNASVLRLVTLPNILLTWASFHAPDAFSPAPPSLSRNDKEGEMEMQNVEGDLEITPELLDAFKNSLDELGMSMSLVAGPWSGELSSLIVEGAPGQSAAGPSETQPASPPQDRKREDGVGNTLILAAETIYNPATTPAFVSCLLSILRHPSTSTLSSTPSSTPSTSQPSNTSASDTTEPTANDSTSRPSASDSNSRALIAAKTLYFGVGGSVADFTRRVEDARANVRTVGGTGIEGVDVDLLLRDGMGRKGQGRGGVGRWIGEVRVS